MNELHTKIMAAANTTGSWNTPQAHEASEAIIREILKEFKPTCKVKTSIGHFYCSGFLTHKENGNIVYWSFSDYRHFPDECLWRTTKSTEDYTGGHNYFGNSYNFIQRIRSLIE